jgi:hypothetical protein
MGFAANKGINSQVQMKGTNDLNWKVYYPNPLTTPTASQQASHIKLYDDGTNIFGIGFNTSATIDGVTPLSSLNIASNQTGYGVISFFTNAIRRLLIKDNGDVKIYQNLNLDNLTPSQYLKTDASKNLVSVSAIPATDVTEDSTHRFATDTEKTIWNNKQDKITYLKITTGDQSSSTNVLANITGLSFVGEANTRYRIQGIICHGQTNNQGLVLAFTCPALASFFVRGYGNGLSLNSIVGIYSKVSGTPTVALNTQATDLGASIFNGEISFGANAGTFNIQFSRFANLGIATIYQLGTNIEIVKLN